MNTSPAETGAQKILEVLKNDAFMNQVCIVLGLQRLNTSTPRYFTTLSATGWQKLQNLHLLRPRYERSLFAGYTHANKGVSQAVRLLMPHAATQRVILRSKYPVVLF